MYHPTIINFKLRRKKKTSSTHMIHSYTSIMIGKPNMWSHTGAMPLCKNCQRMHFQMVQRAANQLQHGVGCAWLCLELGQLPKEKENIISYLSWYHLEHLKGENERLFNNKMVCTTKVADIIKSMTFLWFKHMGKSRNLN